MSRERASWFFVSDLHGRIGRYEALVERAARERPAAILLGGDLLPHPCAQLGAPSALQQDILQGDDDDFIRGFMAKLFLDLRARLGAHYPKVFVILGNDDARAEEQALAGMEREGLWEYVHGRRSACGNVTVFGYACVPPTPFLLKDWERYDVSRFVDPGCSSPEEGIRTVATDPAEVKYATIAGDLEEMAAGEKIDESVWLFHSPPYQTHLDRAALDHVVVEHVRLDVHVGSIAIRRFIEARQPLVTLHGHVHESARLTGEWRQKIGRTWAFSAAHDGPELALVRFEPRDPAAATRELVAT
jgi:Icc-related predicted phosphoesterase